MVFMSTIGKTGFYGYNCIVSTVTVFYFYLSRYKSYLVSNIMYVLLDIHYKCISRGKKAVSYSVLHKF